METLHIVPHVHWDREWYFTARESQILLHYHLKNVLEHLENHPEFKYYVLDGQTSVLKDYLEGASEDKERIEKLVKDGRLIIGPWYTQSDEMIVGAESITRNLYYGYKDSMAFGKRMNVGYLPDSFGQSAQMPMIMNQFGIKNSVFWRGVSTRQEVGSEFRWKSSDDSELVVQQLPLCYALGRFLENDDSKLKPRMDMTLKAIKRFVSEGTKDYVLPNGHDQMPIQEDLDEIVKRLKSYYPDMNIVIDNYENICNELAKRTDLKTIAGELLDGQYARVHRSIYSSRMDLKILNTQIENLITRIVEPISTMAYLEGYDYPHDLYETLWKELLENHAHDSMGNCCSDRAHLDIEYRYLDVKERASMILKYAMRKIADHQECKDLERLVIFNTLPYKRKTKVETTIALKSKHFALKTLDGVAIPYQILEENEVDASVVFRELKRRDEDGNYVPYHQYKIVFEKELPAFGYDTILINEEEDSLVLNQHAELLEDDYYRINLNQDGTVDIFDKANKENYVAVFSFEDGSDEGDEYDYSPLKDDYLINKVEVINDEYLNGECIKTLTRHLKMQIPHDLASRKLKTCEDELLIDLNIKLLNDGLIRLSVTTINNSNDHRLRLLIPTKIASLCSYASEQFGEIKRPLYDECLDVWETQKWDERPDNIYPMLDYVYLKDENHGLGLITNSGREYEITGDNNDVIAYTLFRSVGLCGADNLVRRPGRISGIGLLTPDSQLHQTITSDIAIKAFKNSKEIAKAAEEYLTAPAVYNRRIKNEFFMNNQDLKTANTKSYLELDTDLIYSSIKKMETSEDLMVRVYNPYESECLFDKDHDKTYLDLKEAEMHKENQALKPNEVRTYRIKL